MRFPLAVLAFLLVLNGVFAMSELAVMTSRQSRLQHSAARGNRGAAAALRLAHDPTRFLSTVQVGITQIGILAGAFGENALSGKVQEAVATIPALAKYSDQIALVVVVLGITYFSLVVGELAPKRIALAYPEAVASTIAPPLRTLSRVAAWPIRVLTLSTEGLLRLLRVKPGATADVSEEDVRSIIARAASTGVFNPHEHALFQRVLRAGDLTAAALMVPRADIVWIDENEPLDSVRVLVGTSPHSHFPICRGSLDSVVGVVHIKDLIAYGLLGGADFKATAVAQRPVFIPETMPALRLLDQLQKSRMHLAFVVDEYGGTQGLITGRGGLGSGSRCDVTVRSSRRRVGGRVRVVVRGGLGVWIGRLGVGWVGFGCACFALVRSLRPRESTELRAAQRLNRGTLVAFGGGGRVRRGCFRGWP